MKDKIEISIEEYFWEEPEEIFNEESDCYEETENKVTKYGIDCLVKINAKEVEHYTDVSAFFQEIVNKWVVSNYSYWYGESYKDTGTRYTPITKAWHYGMSNFYPFTCSCGIAGCASIWDGIHVKWRKNSVEWRTQGKRYGYSFIDKQFYSFDRQEYEQQVLKCWKDLCKLVESNPENEESRIVSKVKEMDNFKNSILNVRSI